MAKHNRNLSGRYLGCFRRSAARREDDVDLLAYKIRSPYLQRAAISLRIPQLHHEIVSLYVAEIFKPVFESFNDLRLTRCGLRNENSDPRNGRRRLCIKS